MQPITQLAIDPAAFRERLEGRVVAPGDTAWDDARQAWILSADQRPALVAYPADVADVVTLTELARHHGLRIAVQGTGHNAVPRGDLSGAVLVRMDALRGVEVDAERRVARVKAGTLAGDVTAAASPHRLAPLSGSSPDVSVAGYTLGGGIGWLGRKHGLCADSIVSAEVVLADGRVVRVDQDNEPDLFWALRGGGGSFGVVTELELQLFHVREVHAGWLVWPWERTREILHAWKAWTETAPDEVTTSIRILQLPPLPELPEPLRGAQIIVVDGAVLGDAAFAAETLAALRELEPVMDTFAAVEPGDLIRVHGDPEQPMPGTSQSRLIKDISAEGIDALVDAGGHESGSPLMIVELRQLGGALSRPREGAGALGGFDAEFALFAFGIPAPEIAEAVEAQLDRVMDATASYDAGKYLNFAERAIDTADAFAADRYERLQAIRAEVDPDGLLQPNHEIPAAD
jgi:FAD/FMN-containing dehydrogenase